MWNISVKQMFCHFMFENRIFRKRLHCDVLYTPMSFCEYRGPPRGFWEQGNEGIFSGEQRSKNEGNRGTKAILGNREHRYQDFVFGEKTFISGEQGNWYPRPPGRASIHKELTCVY